MPRKVVQGPIRDKEKTKQKLLNAVGKILKTKGYSGLMVSKIAAVAGFDKKLIYEYFGSTDKLIDEYIRSQDYWKKVGDKQESLDFSDGGKELSKSTIISQFQELKKNKELQKIMLWGLSENRPVLKKIADEREEIGEQLFSNVDAFFGDKATEYRAIAAILVSGAYYMNMYSEYNARKICGIDLKTEEGRKEIEKAMADIVDFAYQKIEK